VVLMYTNNIDISDPLVFVQSAGRGSTPVCNVVILIYCVGGGKS